MTTGAGTMRTALVSGGSRGLGLGVVRALLERHYRVATFARRPTEEVEALAATHADRFRFFAADLADTATLAPVVDAVERELGGIDVLVNCAGVVREALLARMNPGEMADVIQVNLIGTLALTRLALRSMMIRRYGRIVNISSIVSVSGYKGTAAYAASKGGMDAMTRALARELGGRNITVNSVAPGYMDTEMTKSLNPSQLRQIVRRTPLGRPGTVDDVVGPVLFLISDAAGFISGQTLVVDGGLTA